VSFGQPGSPAARAAPPARRLTGLLPQRVPLYVMLPLDTVRRG
jgi:hypothetical protein